MAVFAAGFKRLRLKVGTTNSGRFHLLHRRPADWASHKQPIGIVKGLGDADEQHRGEAHIPVSQSRQTVLLPVVRRRSYHPPSRPNSFSREYAMRLARLVLLTAFIAAISVRAAQAQTPAPVAGTEYVSAVNLGAKDIKIEAKVFIPQGVDRIRGAIVIIAFGLGGTFCCYFDENWRELAKSLELVLLRTAFLPTNVQSTAPVWNDARLGGAEILTRALDVLADESGHAELKRVPLLFWGHSAAGPFGSSFAALHPERTLASIRYHSGPAHLNVDNFRSIPTLFFMGAKDRPDDPSAIKLGLQTRSQWKAGRANGAVWAWALEPDAQHGTVEDVAKANVLMIPWVRAVVRARLDDKGGVREVPVGSGWLADNTTHDIATYDRYPGSKEEASWLPDEASAHGWVQVVRGGAK
jgi:hypothetical protein